MSNSVLSYKYRIDLIIFGVGGMKTYCDCMPSARGNAISVVYDIGVSLFTKVEMWPYY